MEGSLVVFGLGPLSPGLVPVTSDRKGASSGTELELELEDLLPPTPAAEGRGVAVASTAAWRISMFLISAAWGLTSGDVTDGAATQDS